ncbi:MULTISPECIES: hypothetical protein [Pseudomonas]|uniref:hypothetical protein n=1 Tax=Pseudomonas TaxID=286 RepID=UPI0009241346|nr:MULTISPECIES: hypothetical protein [Pseudomonas]SHI35774.1 hypothetical protein SAMN05216295_101366 [Pseudomonas zeshuii]
MKPTIFEKLMTAVHIVMIVLLIWQINQNQNLRSELTAMIEKQGIELNRSVLELQSRVESKVNALNAVLDESINNQDRQIRLLKERVERLEDRKPVVINAQQGWKTENQTQMNH